MPNDLADIATSPATREKTFDADLSVIRAMSTALPGALPVGVNGVRVAASIRPRKFVIAEGDDSPVTMPRTAFQVTYPDCTVMIDSGLDKATHDSFSPDKPEPYFPEEFAKLERALNAARLIVLTHHHADHVGGVVTASNFAALAAKTIITMDVADCLMNTPHRPHLKLTQAAIEQFIVLDYPRYYPVAPGMVLIRAPGHSTDSQMVYVRAVRPRGAAQRRFRLDHGQHPHAQAQGGAVGEGGCTGDHGPPAVAQGGARRRARPDDSRHP